MGVRGARLERVARRGHAGSIEMGEAVWNIEAIVGELGAARRRSKRLASAESRRAPLPNPQRLAEAVAGFTAALFPRHSGAVDHSAEGLSFYAGSRLNAALWALVEQIENEHAFVDETRTPHANSRTAKEIAA